MRRLIDDSHGLLHRLRVVVKCIDNFIICFFSRLCLLNETCLQGRELSKNEFVEPPVLFVANDTELFLQLSYVHVNSTSVLHQLLFRSFIQVNQLCDNQSFPLFALIPLCCECRLQCHDVTRNQSTLVLHISDVTFPRSAELISDNTYAVVQAVDGGNQCVQTMH